MIQKDPYLKGWNDTIFGNATAYYSLPPVVYFMDGDSGILDNAREFKQRIKAFAYVYRLTKDTRWSERAWAEIQVRSIVFTPPQTRSSLFWNSTLQATRSAQRQTSGMLLISLMQLNFLQPMASHMIGSMMSSRTNKRAR